jgi:hypothetical protein
MLATQSPFPQYFDLDGSPLDAGRLYFGQVNQNPETAPITVYWDAAGTQPADQPIRTLNGYTVRNGTPAVIYAGSDYSLTVRDRRGRLVYTAPNSFFFSLAAVVNGFRDDLAGTADADDGMGMLGYNEQLPYADGTGGKALQRAYCPLNKPWLAAGDLSLIHI